MTSVSSPCSVESLTPGGRLLTPGGSVATSYFAIPKRDSSGYPASHTLQQMHSDATPDATPGEECRAPGLLPRNIRLNLAKLPLAPLAPINNTEAPVSLATRTSPSMPMFIPPRQPRGPQMVAAPTFELPAAAKMVSPAEVKERISRCTSSESKRKLLVVDVRSCSCFTTSRVKGAINICIPSTLLKRPGYNLAKVFEILPETDRMVIDEAGPSADVLLYDESSSQPSAVSAGLYFTSLKFINFSDWTGNVFVLRGGFRRFCESHSELVDTGTPPASATDGTSPRGATALDTSRLTGLSPCRAMPTSVGESSFNLTSQNSARNLALKPTSMTPILSGFRLPDTCKDAVPCAMKSIRQAEEYHYVDLSLRVDYAALGISAEDLAELPQWLQRVTLDDGPEHKAAKFLSDQFYDIEKTEKLRLQAALSRDRAFGMAHTSPGADYVTISAGVELGTKNRYKDIFPYDGTRVRVKTEGTEADESQDYINASYIGSHRSQRRYIATQGPLPDTVEDFWRMVWHHGTTVILNLTAEREGGYIKCHNYWNDVRGSSLSIAKVSEETVELPGKCDTQVVKRVLRMTPINASEQPRDVIQIHYDSWPDLGATVSPDDLLALCRFKDELVAQTTPIGSPETPVVVHCSAGCGRTGTFCAVDTVLDILERQLQGLQSSEMKNSAVWGDADMVFEVVHEFRKQRIAMVQTMRQFILCYESILLWLKRYLEAAPK